MKNTPLISIIIPCYNAQDYLEECLDSLLRQTYKNIEIICVDDGSDDNTAEIIRTYIGRNTVRVRLITQKNQYAGVARNNGMKVAEGEYLCFLDADDFFQETMIEEMVSSAQKWGSDIVLCNALYFNNETQEITMPEHILNMKLLCNIVGCFSCDTIPQDIFRITSPVPWNKLYRRAFVEKQKLLFQNTKRCNDEFFVGMSLILAEKISYVNQRFVTYRMENRNSLQGYGNRTISKDFFVALSALKKELEERQLYTKVEGAFMEKVLSTCQAFLNKQQYVDTFAEMYEFIKNTVLPDLGVRKENIKSNNLAIWYQKIYSSSVIEYIFLEWQDLKKSKGEKHIFPYAQLQGARNIAIYAMGDMGKSYYRQIVKNSYYRVVACFDAKYKELANNGMQIKAPEEVNKYEYDKIVIAVYDEKVRCLIKEFLVKQGVSEEKII